MSFDLDAIKRLLKMNRDGQSGWASQIVEALVTEVERLTSDHARLLDYTHDLKGDYDNLDHLRLTLKFALSPEGGVSGWRPPREFHPLVDMALALREEVESLRAQRALGNDDLARSFDMGLEKGAARERAVVAAWLRLKADAWGTEGSMSYAADLIEDGEHLREDGP